MAQLPDVKNGHPPADLETLTLVVQGLSKQVKGLMTWDDRLGSALQRIFHQWIVILLCLVIIGLLAWDKLQLRPDILPYLYVVDPRGEVLWHNVPGSYTITDVMVLNMLEDWLHDVRERPDDPTLIGLWKSWTRAVALTQPDSPARERLNEYMKSTNPVNLTPKPRIEIQVMTKKTRSSTKTVGTYKLSWYETTLNQAGKVVHQPMWEADFTVVLQPPKTLHEAQTTNRYGLLITELSWSEVAGFGG